MWLLIIVLLVCIILLWFKLLDKDVEYLGAISSLQLEIKIKNKRIWNLENEINNLKNQPKHEPGV
jgi:cell division protein FtsL